MRGELGCDLRQLGNHLDLDQKLFTRQALHGQLARRPKPTGSSLELAGAAVDLLERGPLLRVEELARRLHVSPRTLERAFRSCIGLTPKHYLRILRLQRLLRRLEDPAPLPGWAQLALAHGYADQSHLIRDFRALAHSTPERHRSERSPLVASLVAGSCAEPRG